MPHGSTRLGLFLFAVYLVLYGGFVLLAAFSPRAMEATPLAGVNLAIWYGFGLIVAAIVLALIYGWACRPSESRTSTTRRPPGRPAVTHDSSALAIAVFLAFVAVTLGISFYLGKKAKSSAGYFAAHGQIPWFVNGVAFAGDYLSAASFLGICGMIAFYGYDGFLYSIGYLAGWVVALFVVAEPMKRLGKFTFADALNARFNSRGIKLAAGISTLAVSIFYLIPQMVGAGVLVQPLLGLPHWVGVVLVGAVVIFIVVTAGMVSTTWVQFIKGSLLVVFSTVLTVLILARGFHVRVSGGDCRFTAWTVHAQFVR